MIIILVPSSHHPQLQQSQDHSFRRFLSVPVNLTIGIDASRGYNYIQRLFTSRGSQQSLQNLLILCSMYSINLLLLGALSVSYIILLYMQVEWASVTNLVMSVPHYNVERKGRIIGCQDLTANQRKHHMTYGKYTGYTSRMLYHQPRIGYTGILQRNHTNIGGRYIRALIHVPRLVLGIITSHRVGYIFVYLLVKYSSALN